MQPDGEAVKVGESYMKVKHFKYDALLVENGRNSRYSTRVCQMLSRCRNPVEARQESKKQVHLCVLHYDIARTDSHVS